MVRDGGDLLKEPRTFTMILRRAVVDDVDDNTLVPQDEVPHEFECYLRRRVRGDDRAEVRGIIRKG